MPTPLRLLGFALALALAPATRGQAGTLDTSFGDAGLVTVPVAGLIVGPTPVALTPDDRVIVATSTGASTGSPGVVLRLTADGHLDPSFGTGGSVALPADGAGPKSLAVQSDGRVIVFTGGSVFFRLTADGEFDDTFGVGGRASVGRAWTFALLPDDRIVVPTCQIGATRGVLFTLTPDGVPDPTYGANGRGASIGNGCPTDLARGGDGRLVGVAQTGTADQADANILLYRFLPNGYLDTGFGTDGRRYADLTAADELSVVAVQPDGAIVAAGSVGNIYAGGTVAAAVRFLPDGSVDPSFGDAGVLRPFGRGAYVGDVLARPDGHLLFAAGLGIHEIGLAQVLADGTPDPEFGDAGAAESPTMPTYTYAQALALRPDGRVVVAGRTWVVEGARTLFLAQYRAGRGTADSSEPTPVELAASVRPNPVRTGATVAVTVRAAGAARVEVFDVLGRRVHKVWDVPLGAGTTDIALDASGLAPGAYVVVVTTSSERAAVGLTVAR